ncbi:glycosyltransferase family 4 protein [Afifella sp. IM 167]|uniref:glycosyltransferase family 4 protein n=1 Tax=Afifella sp. IM 167 TaxID=2033586 RepID=UPI001CCA08E6|nr:glycosyl transferase [Afifella sp. IM 167]
MKWAYFAAPHLGGTYSHFKHLRAGLAPHGICVEWVGFAREVRPGDGFSEEDLRSGRLVPVPGDADEAARAAALAEMLTAEAYDGVFVNVLAEPVQMNIARYLPAGMARLMIVHNITPATYAAARSLQDWVHATIGVSARCRDDLVGRFGFAPGRTFAIANAVDIAALASAEREGSPSGPRRLLYLGRIEDAAKGVFWLPQIMSRLPSNVSLTVAGDGPDLERLRELCARDRRIALLGAVAASRIPRLLAQHDVMIMPSRFEGFGLTLVEAMATGCVPVVSRLRGVTDRIVSDGENGFLFPVGDWPAAARLLARLIDDPERLAAMSGRARRDVAGRYSLERMAMEYAAVLHDVMANRPAIADPLPLREWAMPAGFRPGLRRYVPRPLKNFLRARLERV